MSESSELEIKLPDAKRRRERDFIALFNALWYRDFPIIRGKDMVAGAAMWTTHIASTVKQCADLLGLFTRFEKQGRTDAVIQKPSSEKNWAKVEWEWYRVLHERVNEIEKLATSTDSTDVSIFIGYSLKNEIPDSLKKIRDSWTKEDAPLLVFIIVFAKARKGRVFKTLQTYRFANGSSLKLREQHALPWEVPGSRWQATASLQDRA